MGIATCQSKTKGETILASPFVLLPQCGLLLGRRSRAGRFVAVMMVMTMVLGGKGRSCCRNQHHCKKGEGYLPHDAFFLSGALTNSKTTFCVCL